MPDNPGSDTGTVAREIGRGGADDPAAQALLNTSWLIAVEPARTRPELQSFGLGGGEEAVLSWALDHPDTTAIIDDRAARRCAGVLAHCRSLP